MTEQRDSDTSRGGSRRVIDWSAVGGCALDWAIATGELTFAVLATGLIGGILGGFIDVVLAFIHDQWAGYGRIAGWTIGAISTAIGMPLGWARGDDNKWSLPSPRKLRKKLATKTGKRRKKASRDFRTISDVLKGGAGFGLVGGVLGFALGGALLMSWFSLAMSPFATADWFESLTFESPRELNDDITTRQKERDGTVISTDSPVAMYLFLSPVLILGAAGAVCGTAYGVVQHVGYLVNVPRDERDREQRQKREPVVEARLATAAALEQGLQPLTPAPREVPAGIRWQLLRGGIGSGVLFGAIFFLAGVSASVLLFIGWRSDPAKFPLVAVTIGLVLVAIGSLFAIASVRAWQGKIRILRHGHLARCRIMTCHHPQKRVWRSYSTVLDEVRAAWDKPLADFDTKGDTKSIERFGVVFGVASIVVFAFMGVVGLVMTIGFLYAAFVQGELVGWVGLGFLVFWWTFIVGLAHLFWRKIRVATTIGQQSLKSLGIEPIVDCRVEFMLPDGKIVTAKTKVDLAPRLAPGKSEPDDVVAYDAWKPDNALLLSGFRPPLEVGENGDWRYSV